jgi:hypothetical protein
LESRPKLESKEEKDMSKASVRHLAWDFLEWSGGMPPDDVFEITVYVDYACPKDFDPTKAWAILNTWMHRQWFSRAESAECELLGVRGDLA